MRVTKSLRATSVILSALLLVAGGVYYVPPGRTSQEPTPTPSIAVHDEPALSPSTSTETSAHQELSRVTVQVTTPRRQTVTRTTRLPGTIAPWYQTTLYAKVPGYLKWIGFDKGDAVKARTVLATIDAPEVQQQYEQAKTDYNIKKLTFERLSHVWRRNPNVIAKQDVDVAEAAARGAQHVLEQRAALVDYTKVRAPFSGVITARFVDPGAMIQIATNSETQASPLFTIMDVAKVRVYCNVPQEEAALAKPGRPVNVRLRQYPERVFTGTITRTTGVLDAATRTMLTEADLPNPDRLLQPGSFAEVEITLQQHPNAVVIPPAALLTEQAGQAVFIVEAGRAKRVPVKTGLDDGVGIEVTQGLQGGEQIVVVGQQHLQDGMPVAAVAYNLPEGQLASQRY
ncbi:MAG TPA: efflux RND transporter periplasmic adaptor subunit [Methylomirabilota bacterium]|nr:efflux RND transporter periplasmic adaptor subunit [Methylomirabilota bacterium]